nr:unnamed protein product [Callosobruchus analis]
MEHYNNDAYLDMFKCDRCGKAYSHKASFYNHRKYTCGKHPNLFCSKCSFATKYLQHMQFHMRLKHDIHMTTSELKKNIPPSHNMIL